MDGKVAVKPICLTISVDLGALVGLSARFMGGGTTRLFDLKLSLPSVNGLRTDGG